MTPHKLVIKMRLIPVCQVLRSPAGTIPAYSGDSTRAHRLFSGGHEPLASREEEEEEAGNQSAALGGLDGRRRNGDGSHSGREQNSMFRFRTSRQK